ncbi:hypothetical protein BP6252_11437 [Coleophoma cylindrospora]|uniref:Leptomycin B resistance protein pmd1 n=1 Tax=Coleophoma cylindrospora TaxID=1849047 RepID=A0A3D8QKP2_9HELO|nr:hypothetical protein BP6252_11437 [Coleophoma cylindrospora]
MTASTESNGTATASLPASATNDAANVSHPMAQPMEMDGEVKQEEKGKKANPEPFDILLLVGGVLSAIASGIPFPLMGILFGQLVDNLNSATCNTVPGAAYQAEVNDKVLKVVYIGIAYFALVYITTFCWSLGGERLAQRLRDRYFKSLLRQEALFFDQLPAGEVSSRLTGDISTIQQGTSEKVGIVLNSVSFFVTAYIVAFIKDAKLGGMLVSLAPALLFMSLVGGHYIQKYSSQVLDNVGAASSIALEALTNTTVVQAFSANARLEAKFALKLSDAKRDGIKKSVAIAIQSGLLYFIAYSGNALAYWQGSKTIANAVANPNAAGGTTVGTTYTVIFILLDGKSVLGLQTAPFLQVFGSAAAAFEKLEKDIESKPIIDGTSASGQVVPHVEGNVELRNVSFTYPSRPDKTVLDNISLVCPAGKHTAIVGLSGSGKSTIAGLITRLYDVNGGAVLLDGHDVKDLNVRSLRSSISLVQQEPSLLDRSILENIAQGLVNSAAHSHLNTILLGSTLEKVALAVREGQSLIQAAEVHGQDVVEIIQLVTHAANISDAVNFINRLKDGFGTLVGASGNLISGGQKQRISVARALVRDPRILILDEATASLDSASELRVQTAIEKAAAGRTLITIAHRLSTIKNTDNIIVMRDGRILEEGTHTNLLARDGAYADLVRLQNVNSRGVEDRVSTRSFVTDDSVEESKDKSETGRSLESAESLQDNSEKETDKKAPNSSVEDVELGPSRSMGSMLKAVGPIFRPYPLQLLTAFISAIVCGGSYSACAVIFGNTIGDLSPCNGESSIRSSGNFWGLMFFVLAIIEFFANLISWSTFGFVAEKVLHKVRILSFRSLLQQDLAWHQSDGRTPSVLLSFITKDGNALAGLTGSTVGTIVSILVNLVAAIILTHIIAWKIALVCLSVVPLMLGAGYMHLMTLSRFAERHESAFTKSIGITVEAVNSIKTVASLSLEEEVLGTYRRSLRGPIKEMLQRSAYANLWLSIAYGLPNFLYALAYWWGAKRIIAGDYSQTQFFIVLMALLVSAQLWGQMFTLAPDVSRASASVNRILDILSIGPTKKLSDPLQPRAKSADMDIEATGEVKEKHSDATTGASVRIQNVKFAYPARPDVEILHGMDLSISPGQFCALVGPSGAGKSTIISLLERMYTPTSGNILIDGVDIAKREGVSFRDKIALVPQESVLFEGTVRFNVALGARPDVEPTDDEIVAACKIANIHNTIISLPDGYATNIGPNGSQLSGGQKQRLAIARALIRKPQLLLLDESTSALDAESEALLQDGLEKAARGITVIAIAHRLYTIRKADVIFLIEDGVCVDSGRHEELVGRSESYRLNALHQAVDGN